MEFGSGSSGKRQNARGFIVVAVLWILAALSALVLIYLTYVTNTAVVVAGSTERVEAEALESAGVELAVYQLTSVKEDKRPTSGTFNAKVGAGRVSVTFRAEARASISMPPRKPCWSASSSDWALRRPTPPAMPTASWPGGRRRNRATTIRKFLLPHLGRRLSAAARAVSGRRRAVAGQGNSA